MQLENIFILSLSIFFNQSSMNPTPLFFPNSINRVSIHKHTHTHTSHNLCFLYSLDPKDHWFHSITPQKNCSLRRPPEVSFRMFQMSQEWGGSLVFWGCDRFSRWAFSPLMFYSDAFLLVLLAVHLHPAKGFFLSWGVYIFHIFGDSYHAPLSNHLAKIYITLCSFNLST